MQEHDPLIIFLKVAIYKVFDTILSTFFYQYSLFIPKIVIIKAGLESMLPGIFFLCDRNLMSFGDILLRVCFKNDKNNDKL